MAANLQTVIDQAWDARDKVGPSTKGEIREAVETVLDDLDSGRSRIAQKDGAKWTVNQWLKKAVLLSFRLNDSSVTLGGPHDKALGPSSWFDKVPSKFSGWDEAKFKAAGFRAVPNCVVRRSAYIAPNVVLMPSFVNVGAYVDSGTMVDTWATVGSCAQIGKNCHISGGAGIGGVLEPLQAEPVIVEDNCFIGARSEVAEGVIVETGAVLSMGVYIGASTKIVDRTTGEIHMGRVPAYSVVAPGNLPGKPLANGEIGPSTYCAVILKRVDAGTRAKTSINELLRELTAIIDPVALTRELIRRPSVTPKDEGALDVLEGALRPLGFKCQRLRFSEPGEADIDNLYARLGTGAPHFCFAGHTDVVPTGDLKGWTVDPFAGETIDGHIYGRGAADMKAAIAAFAAAAEQFLSGQEGFKGSISFLITGDEEGVAVNGTVKMLKWIAEHGEKIDACVVGEPTNQKLLGDMIKIGRRGAATYYLTVNGVQGHSAYPHLADNPIHRLVKMLDVLTSDQLDQGSDWFQPSTLQVTSVDVGNPAANVIPAQARAMMNVRFSDRHTAASVERWIRERLDRCGGSYELTTRVTGESFLTKPGALSDLVSEAVASTTGRNPELSTTGGTSDARFIRNYCPVVEFGLVGLTMHKMDERASLADITALTAVYRRILDRYFVAA